ncbi:unnamed protein product [Orchesella dallaii]|uniref:CARD domain-containing protein n=1 Tax=Orchesella dallaii TaxID=48710 RepID=A0ABP1S8J4_9HEXA
MLKWQQEHIRKNLTTLMHYTSCDTLLLSKLFAQEVLNQDEWDRVAAVATKLDKSKMLFDIITTRVNGYEKLMEAAIEFNQTGTYEILESGVLECHPNTIQTTPQKEDKKDQEICFPLKTVVITEQQQPTEEIVIINSPTEIKSNPTLKNNQDSEDTTTLSKWELIKIAYKLDNLEREKRRKERKENEERIKKINNHLDKLRPRPGQLKSKTKALIT